MDGHGKMAVVHVAMPVVALIVSLAVAWEHDGPPADKAFWAILVYFVEIAAMGLVAAGVALVGWVRSGDPAASDGG